MNNFWNNLQFSEKNIILGLKAENKETAILELVTNLTDQKILAVSNSFLLKKVMEREKMGSTGMQGGIAMPHLRTDVTDGFFMVLGISEKGINFDSLDGKPTHIILLSIVSEDMVDAQLKYLAKMSVFFSAKGIIEKILSSKNSSEIYNLLCDNI